VWEIESNSLFFVRNRIIYDDSVDSRDTATGYWIGPGQQLLRLKRATKAYLILAPPGAATELGLLDELANATLEDRAGIHDVH
jgi:hypothetical protein